MPILSTVRASNADWSPSYTPVGILVGGTSGIGQGIAEAFAQHTNGNAHIVLVGRNRTAILSRLPRPSRRGITHEFRESDLSLVRNVKRTAAEILARFERVNVLMMTAGVLSARWAFIGGLLPGLRAAQEEGEDARVMVVMNAGNGTAIDVKDLGLKKILGGGMSGLPKSSTQLSTYQDLIIEVRRNSSLRCFTHLPFQYRSYASNAQKSPSLHTHLGAVVTPLMKASPSPLIRCMQFVYMPIFALCVKSIEECGEYQLYALLTAPAGIGYDTGYAGSEEDRKRLWKHTEEVVGEIQ
ncbi:hypothetical protein B0H11DRAFT_2164730 [Mycena galericulata]|nr:hypothetical protein B0H11DRAFT_2164730 [Mycena galericulata]